MATQDLAIASDGGGEGTYVGGAEDYTNLNDAIDSTFLQNDAVGIPFWHYHAYNMVAFTTVVLSIDGVTEFARYYLAYGTDKFKVYVIIGGVTYYGDEWAPGVSGWYENSFTWALSPATGVKWTKDELNGAQFGIGQYRSSTPNLSKCTFLKITVDYTLGIGFHTAAAQTRYKASTFSTFTFPDPAGSGFTSDTASYAMLAGWGGAPIPSLLYQLLASDGIKLSDAAVAQSLISLLASDGLKLSDAATVYKFLSLLASDGVKLSDSSVAQLIAQAAVIDGAKFSDSATVGLLFNLLTSDGIKLSDSAVIIKVISEIVADGVKFSDSAAAGLIFQVLASDGIKLSDSAILELLAIILLIRKLQKRTLTAKLYQRDFILKLPDRSLVTKKEE